VVRLAVVVAITLVCLSAAPGAAVAAGWKTERATLIARIVWHDPCVDRMQIQWGAVPPGADGASAWAWTDRCIVVLNDQQPQAWEPFCSLVLHEAGHLAGMGHTDHGIMEPFSVFVHDVSIVNGRRAEFWDGTDPRCRGQGIPYLQAHRKLTTEIQPPTWMTECNPPDGHSTWDCWLYQDGSKCDGGISRDGEVFYYPSTCHQVYWNPARLGKLRRVRR